MQAKVPQQLLTYEDKVIGPLTFRQFIYLTVGIGVSLTLIVIFPSSVRIIGFIIAAPVLGGFVTLAFLKLQGRTTETLFKAFVISLLRPRQRIWQREISGSLPAAPKAVSKAAAPAAKQNVRDIRSSLEKLAMVVDTSGLSAAGESLPAEAPLAARVIRPESEATLESLEAPDIIESEHSQKLTKTLSEVETKVEREHEHKVAEPSVAKLTKPAKHYHYDYRDVEVSPPADNDELEKMIFQYHRTHPDAKLKPLKHGEAVHLRKSKPKSAKKP